MAFYPSVVLSARAALYTTFALLLAACGTVHDAPSQPMAAPSEPVSTSVASPMPEPLPSNMNPLVNGGDSRVQVFPLDGPVINPLALDQTRSQVDNTTSGGFTVFDDSVTVYPVDTDTTPTYMPNYAVPPLAVNATPRAKTTIGKPLAETPVMPDPLDTALAENPRAVMRQPLAGGLTPMPGEVTGTTLAGAATPATAARVTASAFPTAGARSMPILTGY